MRGNRRASVASALTALVLVTSGGAARAGDGGWQSTPPLPSEVAMPDRLVTDAAGTQGSVDIASDGSGFLVVWEDARQGGLEADIYAARLDPRGAVVDRTAFPVSTAPFDQTRPAVAWTGGHYLVAWEDTRRDGVSTDVFAARVARNGTVLDPGGIPVATLPFAQAGVDVSSGGGTSVVVWEDDRAGDFEFDIAAARIAADGTVLDPGGFRVNTADGDQLAPAIAWGSGRFMVVWADDRDADLSFDVYATGVLPDGAVTDQDGSPISTAPGDQSGASVASDGVTFLAVWKHSDPNTFVSDLHGAIVAPDTAIRSRLLISDAPGEQFSPDVAWGGDRYAVVWNELDVETFRFSVAAATVTPDGHPSEPFTLGDNGGIQPDPAVAGTPTLFSVAWQMPPSRIVAGGISSDGEAVSSPQLISRAANRQAQPAVASSGEMFLVVWQDYRGDSFDIHAARLDAAGNLLDEHPIVVSDAPADQVAPDVAWNGGYFFVVWEDLRSGSSYDVFGAGVTIRGDVLEPDGFRISPQRGSQFNVAVTSSGGGGSLVVWEDFGGEEFGDLRGVLVGGSAPTTPAFTISAAPGDQRNPAVAWDGRAYLVAWEDARFDDFTEIFATRVTGSGVVLDRQGIQVTSASHLQVEPTVACRDGRCLLAWADSRVAPFSFDVFGRIWRAEQATLSSEEVRIAAARGDQRAPSVTPFEGTFTVVWRDARAFPTIDIGSTRVSANGVVRHPEGARLTSGGTPEGPPDVAGGDGSVALVYPRFVPLARYRIDRVFARVFA